MLLLLSWTLGFFQILECNGVSFHKIDLADAVVHLKSGKELDLLIQKGSQVTIPNELFTCKFLLNVDFP